MAGLVIGWRKSMTKPANTYMLDIAGDELWFGYLGKGGAHWEPGTPRYSHALHHNWGSGGVGGAEGLALSRASHAVGANLGMAAGKAILNKFQEEIDGNVDRFLQEGRPGLAGSKQTWTATKSDFAGAELVEKMPGTGPPALRDMGPYIKAKPDGKDYYVIVTPDTGIGAEELLGLLA